MYSALTVGVLASDLGSGLLFRQLLCSTLSPELLLALGRCGNASHDEPGIFSTCQPLAPALNRRERAPIQFLLSALSWRSL
jgi:hypothetical protein